MIGTVSPPLVIFVAMPGTDMGPHATWRNTAEIKQHLYEPVADQVKATLGREVDLRIEKDKIGQGVIHRSMFNEALRADVYIVDLTGANPNVYLELGVRWTLRDHVTVLVCQNEEHDIKFNVSSSRFIHYGPEPPELKLASEKIVRAILKGLADGSDGATDSLVRQYLDKIELHLGDARIHPEPTGRHTPRGRLLRYFRTHTWTLADRKKFRRRRTVSTSAIGYAGLAMTTLFLGVFLGTSYGGAEDASRVPSVKPHEIGDAYPSPKEEFLAQFVNQSSGKCITRNMLGIHSDAETEGADIYQYACPTEPDSTESDFLFPQALVLVPLRSDSWMIRSSIRSDLCVQSGGKPGKTSEDFQICKESDDRQEWVLRGVRNADPEIALVRNRQSDRCLAHGGPPGGNPESSAEAIFEIECQPEDRTEWLIKKLAPLGLKECRDQQIIGIRNRETGNYVNYGDGNLPRMGNREQMISLTPAARSAHGCTVHITGPPERCIEVPVKGSPEGEAIWMPCNSARSGQRWVIESLGKLDGKDLLGFRPIDDTSRCLAQSGKDVKTTTLTASRCPSNWSWQWVVE